MKLFPDEKRELVRHFSDKARKSIVVGDRALIPHKVKRNGKPVTVENFVKKYDISNLNMEELQFLDVFRDSGWDFDKACESLGLEVVQARKTYQKCLWFPQEEAYVKALAAVPTSEYVKAKDIKNLEHVERLDDSDHKSLDRLSKILGIFKSGDVNITQNVLQMPQLTPEQEMKLRTMADSIAVEEVQVA